MKTLQKAQKLLIVAPELLMHLPLWHGWAKLLENTSKDQISFLYVVGYGDEAPDI
jgi:hypothetical protein